MSTILKDDIMSMILKDEDEDPLDMLADVVEIDVKAPKPAVARSVTARALRPRSTNWSPAPSHPKRKRADGVENIGGASDKKKMKLEDKKLKTEERKVKMEDKKARTTVASSQRTVFEATRKRWLYRHRNVFMPVLPSGRGFFENLQHELAALPEDASYVQREEFERQPNLVKGGEMKDYQLQGLSFLVWMYRNGMNCILGDEMGLGKTLQTLALFAHIKENETGSSDPHLIICPLSVIGSWINEVGRWVPSMRVLRFHGTQAERTRLKDQIRDSALEFDLLITTYESYSVDDSWFKTRRWSYCVLDEGHRIKNPESNLSRALQGIGAQFRMILTGTPVHNSLSELWGLFHWLYPTIFTAATEARFKDAFSLSEGKYDVKFLEAAQKLLEVLMLRRTKNVVEFSVPPREEHTVFLPLTEAQRFWTYKLLTRMDELELNHVFNASLNDEEGRKAPGAQGQYKKLMNLLMQLRQCCDHPYILADAEPEPFYIGEHLVSASSKLIVIDKLLADLLPKGERVLIFSQWIGMLDLLEDFMALRGIPYARLDGSTTRARRALDIKLFQQEKSPYQVFLISTRAGGLGINLTKASHVIVTDSDWNPQIDLQAIARAHRIGQTKTVKVYRLICRGSVEDQMLDRIRRKLFLSVKVMGSSSAGDTENAAMKTKELMSILRNGSSALGTQENSMDLNAFLSAPIDEILRNSRRTQDVRDAKIKQEVDGEADAKLLDDAAEEERLLLSGVAQVQSRLFEGGVHQVQATNKQIANEWQKDLEKRARMNRLVVVNGIASLPFEEIPASAKLTGPPVVKRKQKEIISEEYCIYCRDGGTMFTCHRCPRVFHAECHGMSEAECARIPMLSCPQHNCASCLRNTADAGGMLFRCQTCPQAFCEDCMPEGEIPAIGDTLPEFELLGYGPVVQAYYIRCQDCQEHFAENPEALASWMEEEAETARKIAALRAKDL